MIIIKKIISLRSKTNGSLSIFRFFALSLCMLIFLSATAQTGKVSVSLKNASLKQFFNAIEKQTFYRFSYRDIEVQGKSSVTVDAENDELKSLLISELTKCGLTYVVSGNKIIVTSSQQQNKAEKIAGKVVDVNGEPVIGATVMEKGTTNGTITDVDGNFTLDVASDAKLEVSYIGYKNQVMNAVFGETMNIILKEDTKVLDEVVVVGYGTQKKANVIGSITMVESKDLENRATSSVVSSLIGQMPGVTIITAGGRPGVNTGTLRVRGVGSFGASPEALVLIDGIPGNITDVNSNDIESISVLKDAATAAIYGARAANGVVLVTTKMGKESKMQVAYNGYIGFNTPTALPEFVDSWDYARLLNEAEGVTRFTDEDIQAMKDGTMPDVWANENTMDALFSGDGFQTGHTVSLNGGGVRSQYFASLGYLSQDGVVPHNNYSRYTGRLNLTSELVNNLKLTVRLRGDRSNVKEPGIAGAIDGVGLMGAIIQGVRFPGFRPSQLTNGNWGPGVKNVGTAKAWLASESFSEKPVMRLNTSAILDFTPVKGLKLSLIGAYNFINTASKQYRATLPIEINGTIKVLGPSGLNQSSENEEYKSLQATADYQTSIADKHNLNVLVGYSWEDSKSRDIGASRQNYPNNNYPYLTVGSPDVQKNYGGGNDWVIQSLLGRLQYNYAERYLFETTMRYDGSSRFPTDSRYAFFPSAAVGWRISEESFFKKNKDLSFINNLKFKASVGMLGNNNIGNYAYQSTYVLGNAYNYPFGGVVKQGAQLVTYTDPKLKWETTRTFDIGFESVLWDGLLTSNVTYFNRYTYDILYKPNASASCIFGLDMSEVNTGEASNRGWEFELGHRNSIGDFKYAIHANFSIIENKVESLGIGDVLQPNGLVGNGSSLFIGYPMQMYYGYKTDGVFLNQEDIDTWFAHTDQSAMGAKQADIQPGDLRYVDVSGPDGVPDGKVDATYDRVYLGSRIPKYTYGVTLNAGYKGFDFNLFFQGVAGVKGELRNYAGWAFFSEGNVQKWQMEEAFDPKYPTRYPGYPRIQNLGNTIGVNNQQSDFWVRNASYLRVKNIQLGYTLPKSLTKSFYISSLRFYVSAENAITFNHYPTGWDPEINSDGSFYPILANYTFGLNLKF